MIERKNTKCILCRKKFTKEQMYRKVNKYCGSECAAIGRRVLMQKCAVPTCTNEFKPKKHGTAKFKVYCGISCAKHHRRSKWKYVPCRFCGRDTRGKYCDLACQIKYKKKFTWEKVGRFKEFKKCKGCDKNLKARNSAELNSLSYCSRYCFSQARTPVPKNKRRLRYLIHRHFSHLFNYEKEQLSRARKRNGEFAEASIILTELIKTNKRIRDGAKT